MSKSTDLYFKNRIQNLGEGSVRGQLGIREFLTIKNLLDWFFQDRKIINNIKVLDLGCGDRFIQGAFESEGNDYAGIDFAECNLETESMPFANDNFDLVLCLALLEHLENPRMMLEEIQRILKPGGVVIMTTPNINQCGNGFWDDPTHVRPYNPSAVRTLMSMHGYENIIVTPNLRCKHRLFYGQTKWHFYAAKYLFLLRGFSEKPIIKYLRGKSTGLYVLCQKPGMPPFGGP